jgi:carbamoyltransferase
MIILAIHAGQHDASAALFEDYRVLGAVGLERLTRLKGDGVGRDHWAWPCVDELLSMNGLTRTDVDVVAMTLAAMPRLYYRKMRLPWHRIANAVAPSRLRKRPTKLLDSALHAEGASDPARLYDAAAFLAEAGFRRDTSVHWCNHQLAHALPSLFFTDWSEALLYTADGIGDNASYSAHSFRDGRLETLFGGKEMLRQKRRMDSIGFAYGIVTIALGFRMLRHEGKVTGLAAFGEPAVYEQLQRHFTIDESGHVRSDWTSFPEMQAGITALLQGVKREDAAASVQKLLEVTVLSSVQRLLALHPHRRLGLSGGVFANVRLNRTLAESAGIDEVFVVPPMGDDGLPLGAGLGFLMERDGIGTWLERRHRLDDLYWGRDYDGLIDAAIAGERNIARSDEAPAAAAAARLAAGQIGAIYAGRMEFGPRALGARSILANPSRRETHDELNRRLSRTEFMPFAPVVTEENAARVFAVNGVNAYACRFMTITTDVRPEWRQRIAAVVHVDGSARPQVIARAANPLYYDILTEFEKRTGLPVLVNTSFNVHEEPIVNGPAECIRALLQGRIDFVVTRKGLYAVRPALAEPPEPRAGSASELAG